MFIGVVWYGTCTVCEHAVWSKPKLQWGCVAQYRPVLPQPAWIHCVWIDVGPCVSKITLMNVLWTAIIIYQTPYEAVTHSLRCLWGVCNCEEVERSYISKVGISHSMRHCSGGDEWNVGRQDVQSHADSSSGKALQIFSVGMHPSAFLHISNLVHALSHNQ